MSIKGTFAGTKGKTSSGEPENWFDCPRTKQGSKDAAKALTGAHKELRTRQRGRIEADILHMSLYAGRRLSGYGIGSYWKNIQTNEPGIGGGLAVNIIKNACNAVVSKVGKNRPKPSPVTDEASSSLQIRAEGIERFLYGAFYEAGVDDVRLKWLLQACVLGTGLLKPFRMDDPTNPEDPPKLGVEVSLPGSVTVDDYDAIDGKPLEIRERRYIDKHKLALLYPAYAEEIMKAEMPQEEGVGLHNKNNQVMVVEAWRLPAGPIRRGKDGKVTAPKAAWGRHLMALDDIPLVDEPYFFDRFPHISMRYDDELLGFWGCGIAYQGFGYQSAINRMLLKEQQSEHLVGVPHIFMDRAWGVEIDSWTNEIGTFIMGNYNGNVPQVITPQLFGPAFYQQMERLREWFFQDLGISQMMAQGEKPAGITAAVALEAISDSDSERAVKLMRRWEQAHVDLGNWFIDLAKQINEGDPELGYVKKDYAVVWHGADSVSKMKWKDVDMERDQFVLKVQATSSLPDSLAARKQFLTDLRNQGDIDQAEYMTGLNLGEFKQQTSLKTAPYRYLQKVAEKLRKGTWVSPEPTDNLQMSATFINSELQKLKVMDDVTEETLQLFRDYLVAIQALLNPPQAAVPPVPGQAPPMDPNMVPPEMGGAPPMPPGGMPPMPPAPMGPPN